MFPTMTHYCTKEADGTIHVQNAVMGHLGQHHVHTAEDFAKWRRRNKIPESAIEWMKGMDACDCGLKAGEVRSGL